MEQKAYSAFGEYQLLNEKLCIPVPYASPEILPVMVSGLTASIALEQCGNLKIGKTVLVTAGLFFLKIYFLAAGATGQFAVQFAKLAGCHVIGTCSSESKVKFLKSLGVDRAINYKKENLKNVLKKEYPKGLEKF
jgi:prostaglandin reductase 3